MRTGCAAGACVVAVLLIVLLLLLIRQTCGGLPNSLTQAHNALQAASAMLVTVIAHMTMCHQYT